jgi:molybdopterin converting factor subunit 1
LENDRRADARKRRLPRNLSPDRPGWRSRHTAATVVQVREHRPVLPYNQPLMQITVRFFAILREKAGVDQMPLQLNDGSTVAEAIDRVGERLPTIRALLPRAAFAVNRTYVKPETLLSEGDELALIPPVSGG